MLHLGAVRNIAGEKLGVSAHVADQAQGRLRVGIQFQIVDADVTAALCQSQGNAAADAALAAGDEGFLAVE